MDEFIQRYMIRIEPLQQLKQKPTDLAFGKHFTDRMFLAEWKSGLGWHNERIIPYAPFTLDPSALVFHYGQEIFEGLKAYAWEDGTIALFRPEMNAERFNASANRLCMPEVPSELFLEAVEQLVLLEKEWIPSAAGTSLYIRPTMIAVEPILGVRPSSHYYFYIILSPVGPYYPNGFEPVKIWVEDRYVRASRGGTGEAKTGGNYASSLKASVEAKMKGFTQVLWLDSKENRYIEEVGVMNLFIVHKNTLITPPLEGTILHGITRDTVIELARHMNVEVKEHKIPIDYLMEEIRRGAVTEAFGTGTAAVISPVSALSYKDELLTISQGGVGPLSQKFYTTLTAIQYGKSADPFGWVKKIASIEAVR